MNIFVTSGLFAAGIMTGYGIAKHGNFDQEFTVNKKFVSSHPIYFGGDRYMLELKDKNGDEYVFRTGMNIWNFNFDRKGKYDEIKVGETYRMKGYGINYPKLHLYKNVTKASNVISKEDDDYNFSAY